MSSTTTVSYSLKTGNRVTEKFAQRNPNYVKSFAFVEGQVPVEFLKRGQTLPATLEKAEAADEARKAAAAKAEAEAAKKVASKGAKKATKKAAKKVVKKAAKKKAKKTTKKASTKRVLPASQSGLVNKK